MTGKNEELNPKDLESAQGGAGFQLSAEKTANRMRRGELPAGESAQSGTDPIDEAQLQVMRGGAGFQISAEKAANREAREGLDPKNVIQDPWGGPADPEPKG